MRVCIVYMEQSVHKHYITTKELYQFMTITKQMQWIKDIQKCMSLQWTREQLPSLLQPLFMTMIRWCRHIITQNIYDQNINDTRQIYFHIKAAQQFTT